MLGIYFKEVPQTGSPFAAGTSPQAIATDPTGRFLYVSNGTSKNMSAYSINLFTGALTPVPGSPFPDAGGKWQVSVGGGTWPRWSRRGSRLYYVHEDTIMEVDVSPGPEPRLGAPRAVFTRKSLGWPLIFGWPPGFDVSPQEDRFVVVQSLSNKQDLTGIMVVENWFKEFNHAPR